MANLLKLKNIKTQFPEQRKSCDTVQHSFVPECLDNWSLRFLAVVKSRQSSKAIGWNAFPQSGYLQFFTWMNELLINLGVFSIFCGLLVVLNRVAWFSVKSCLFAVPFVIATARISYTDFQPEHHNHTVKIHDIVGKNVHYMFRVSHLQSRSAAVFCLAVQFNCSWLNWQFSSRKGSCGLPLERKLRVSHDNSTHCIGRAFLFQRRHKTICTKRWCTD